MAKPPWWQEGGVALPSLTCRHLLPLLRHRTRCAGHSHHAGHLILEWVMIEGQQVVAGGAGGRRRHKWGFGSGCWLLGGCWHCGCRCLGFQFLFLIQTEYRREIPVDVRLTDWGWKPRSEAVTYCLYVTTPYNNKVAEETIWFPHRLYHTFFFFFLRGFSPFSSV